MSERKNSILWRRSPTPDRWLFEDEPLKVTSAGVLVHTNELVPRNNPSFLFVEKLDEPNRPWGIPAGRVEIYETNPKQTAIRELEEETGLRVGESELKLFLSVPEIYELDETRLVYSMRISLASILRLGDRRFSEDIWIVDRVVPEGSETGRLAVVPRERMFCRGHPVISSFYRWDVMHGIKARLEGLRII